MISGSLAIMSHYSIACRPIVAQAVRERNVAFKDRTYAVSDPAFGRAVLCLLLCFGFCARRAQKPKHRYHGKYHAAGSPEPVEGQAKRRVCAALPKSCQMTGFPQCGI